MINDKRWVFSDQQNMDGTGAVVSDKRVDLGMADPNQGEGTGFIVRAVCDSDFAGGTDLTVALQHSDTEGSGYVDLVIGAKYDLADLKKGTVIFKVRVPDLHKRFLSLNFTRTGTFTGGHGINAYANITP